MERRRKKGGGKKWWSDEQRLQAAATYVMLGSWSETALATGIPLQTLKAWRHLPWWKDMLSQVRRDDLDQTSAKMQKIIQKAIAATEDRLDNGNFVFDQKTGKVVRIPVNIKDTLKVATDLLNRQDKIAEMEQHKDNQEATVDRLQKLADELAKFAKAKPVEAIEIKPTLISTETVLEPPQTTQDTSKVVFGY